MTAHQPLRLSVLRPAKASPATVLAYGRCFNPSHRRVSPRSSSEAVAVVLASSAAPKERRPLAPSSIFRSPASASGATNIVATVGL